MTVHYLATICLGFYLSAALLYLLQVVRGINSQIRPRLLLFVGFLTHSALIVPFISSTQVVVPENRGEYLFWLSWALVAVYFLSGKRVNYPVFGAFVAPLSAFFLTGSSYLAHQSTADKNIASEPLFQLFHMGPAMLSEFCLVIAFILSWIFIIQERRLKRKKSVSRAFSGPSLEVLENFNHKALTLGFISMTFAVLSGTLWAYSEHVSILGKDLYQWVAILAWVFLGLMLHFRLNLHWSATRLARFTLVVAGTVIASVLIMIFFIGNNIHGGYRI